MNKNTALAGLMPVQNYQDYCGAFHMLEALSEWTCVLDDNSRTPFKFADDADEYLTLRRGTLWNDTGNRTMLMYRAFLAGYTRALVMDHDLIPSRALFSTIKRLGLGLSGYPYAHIYVPLRDVWDHGKQYRTDGAWGEKTYPILQQVPAFDKAEGVRPAWVRLHSTPLPIKLHPKDLSPFPKECCLYHFGSLTKLDRESRVMKYLREDGGNEFQDDYSYLADDGGATFAPVPEEDVNFIADWMIHRKLPEA